MTNISLEDLIIEEKWPNAFYVYRFSGSEKVKPVGWLFHHLPGKDFGISSIINQEDSQWRVYKDDKILYEASTKKNILQEIASKVF